MIELFKDPEKYIETLEKETGKELSELRFLLEDWRETKHRLQKTTLSIKAHPDYQTGRNQEFIDIVELNEKLL